MLDAAKKRNDIRDVVMSKLAHEVMPKLATDWRNKRLGRPECLLAKHSGFAFLEMKPANRRGQYSDEWTTPRAGDWPVYCCSFGALAPALAPDCSVDSSYSVPCKKMTVNCLLPSGSVLMT